MAQAVASLEDPHFPYEHVKVSFMREALDQPAARPATRLVAAEGVGCYPERN